MSDPNNPEPHHKPRRLILCFDGTANLFSTTNTNVVRLMTLLKKDDYNSQMVYYQSGVGTYMKPSWVMPFMNKAAKILADMVAWDIPHHIMGGYEFLMQNWLPGDKIYLFGFSRGSYTARALAGMLQKVGLLSRGNNEQIPFAYHMYKRADAEGWRMSTGFKKAFCNPVDIDFVGVWDTVSSVGVFSDEYFPFTASNHHIRVFRHALSLDEHRCKFQPNLYHRTPHPLQGLDDGAKPKSKPDSASNEYENEKGSMDTDMDEKDHSAPPEPPHTDVEEVWFSGGHGDVGGGNVSDTSATILARIPLTWMLRETILANTGIEFDSTALAEAGIDLSSVHPSQKKPPIKALDRHYAGDLVAPQLDMLQANWCWWILEFLPFRCFRQGRGGEWEKEYRANLGGPRAIPPPTPPTKVHVSVKERMIALGKYKPRAKWEDVPDPDWVD